MKTTREIENEYDITRQTLHNWISERLITSPEKDWRGWFRWDLNHEQEIGKLIKEKYDYNNQETFDRPTETLKIYNRRYLGSKLKILNFIEEVVDNNTSNIEVVADIFGGTGTVADLFRKKGKNIIINDILYSNYVSFITWFGNEDVDYEKIKRKIGELNQLSAEEENYVSDNFGNLYFSMENARKIGTIREKIETYKDLGDREKSFLLTSLMYAMDKVANTVGHYDSYRQKMDSFKPIYLRVPELNKNQKNLIYQEDANKLIHNIKADLVYIDTPYNSRQYGDAYHLLENIMKWEKPKVSGVSKKFENRQHIKSDYSTNKAPHALHDLILNINARYILVSYNNMAQKGDGRSNAKISNEEIISFLEERGDVTIFSTDFNAFTTGKTDIKDHKEFLYLCEVKGNNNVEK